MVVDRDAPDKLEHAAEKDWLDEVCEVRGDTLDVDSDYADDSGKENEDEGEEPWPGPSLGRGLRGRQPTESVDDRERPLPEDRPRPAARFTTAWNLERGSAEYNSVRETKKRKNQEAAVIGARSGKLVKVSLQPALAQGKVKISKESDNKRLRLPPSSPLQMQLEHSLWAKMAPAPKSKSNLPLNRDSSGRLKGAVMLGTRRRFDKNS